VEQRDIVFYDTGGRKYQPVKHHNRQTGRSAYRVKPPGASNKTGNFIELDTIEALAKAMLVDGLPARVKAIDGTGPVSVLRFGADVLQRYELAPSLAEKLGIPPRSSVDRLDRRDALNSLRTRFLTTFPDFEAVGCFTATTGAYYESYRRRVDALLAAAATHPADGWAVLQDVVAASQGSRGALPPFFDGDVNWRVPRVRNQNPTDFDAALDALVAGRDQLATAVETFNTMFGSALDAIGAPNTFRDTRVVPSTVLAAIAPDHAVSVRYQVYSNAARLLEDRALFANKPMSAVEYGAVLALAERIRDVMTDWGWMPRDLWDVHGFILHTCGTKDHEMNDEALLKRFASAKFDVWQKSWTATQKAAFCKMARTAHDAGLDWYHTNMAHNPVRLGRKPDVNRRARQTLGYLDLPSAPRIWLSDKPGKPKLGQHAFPLDEAGAEAFAEAFRRHGDRIVSWGPPTPKRPGRWPDEAGDGDGEDEVLEEQAMMQPDPTNLILYGPPGTGKTFATARHAVRLCGEEVPEDRHALMARYAALAEAGRIEFVTFHQSMAYEEFVEGLRPSSFDEDGKQVAAGFRLAPTPGIFRKIARRAETSTGPGTESFAIGDRKVFKMSIGEASNPDDAYLFEEAIAGGFTLLGFGDHDWSDTRFADRGAMIEVVRAAEGDDKADATSGRIQMPHIFRNWMRSGDVVVVSKGNGLFRAIGEITGDYEYAPREGDGYGHRRAVRWLWVDRAGVPTSEIYNRAFTMKSVYLLTPADLNIPALERYANSQQDSGSGAPEPFVLIIDEINRANISKVFGELITLLESDKRLGKPNALKVRLPYSGESFGVPANLHIIGTMNTADRSIALIDKALRRRFTFTEMMPDYGVPGMDTHVADAGVTLSDILRTINDRIEYLLDREHQIGHGWLLGCTSKTALDAAMREKVIPLIAEYFFEDWGRTADVLGGREDNPFLQAETLYPPPGLADGQPRTRWSVRDTFSADAYIRLIG